MQQSRKRRIAFLLFIIVLACIDLPAVGARRETTHRVQFDRGRTTVTLKGTVTAGDIDHYMLRARAGQTMTIHLSSTEHNAAFTVYPPHSRTAMKGAEQVTDWTLKLPQSGDYVISVIATYRKALYMLEVTIPPTDTPASQSVRDQLEPLFDGRWVWSEKSSVCMIDLTQTGRTVTGYHSCTAFNGKRIDTILPDDDNGPSISGIIEGVQAKVIIRSGYSGAIASAEILHRGSHMILL
jgi:hypothetical protein